MARPVYSTAFLFYGPGATNHQFLVPSGFVAVIRDITGIQAAAPSSVLQMNAGSPDNPIPFFYHSASEEIAQIHQEMRVVVAAPGLIEIDSTSIAGLVSMIVSGYLLTDA